MVRAQVKKTNGMDYLSCYFLEERKLWIIVIETNCFIKEFILGFEMFINRFENITHYAVHLELIKNNTECTL